MNYKSPELHQAIGARIRAARENAGLTQPALAEQVGVTRAAVSNYETGKTGVQLESLLRLADVLGVKPSALIDGQGPSRLNAAVAYWRRRALAAERRVSEAAKVLRSA